MITRIRLPVGAGMRLSNGCGSYGHRLEKPAYIRPVSAVCSNAYLPALFMPEPI